MLWYCAYTWHSGTTREKIAQRLLEQDQTSAAFRQKWRGWYALAGGGSGFLLVDTDDPRELTAMLQPYMDLLAWDVRAIYELNYDEVIGTARQVAG